MEVVDSCEIKVVSKSSHKKGNKFIYFMTGFCYTVLERREKNVELS